MTPHLRRSRIAKALTDRSDGETGFDSAEDRLDKIRVAVVLTGDQAKTAAAQAAALTAVSTSFKCFGSATLVAARGTRLIKPATSSASRPLMKTTLWRLWLVLLAIR
jgi:hypothetical protein